MLSVLRDMTFVDGHNPLPICICLEKASSMFCGSRSVMGDPDFVDVPVEAMLADDRIDAISASFDPSKTLGRTAYGSNFGVPTDGGTHHLSVLDEEGMAVALTTTINTSFGSEVVADQSGLLLNNEMDDFVAKPGVPNSFGLVGREAHAVEPGKKPLSSMSPTVVFTDGEVRLVVGASGGPFIISSTLQAISNVIDFGMDAQEAVFLPRMHHQWVRSFSVDQGILRTW